MGKISDHTWSQDIIIVQLPSEPRTSDEIETVSEIVLERNNCDVILDFSQVDTVSCLILCQFVKLQRTMTDLGRCLFFCNLSAKTRSIFTVNGFDRIFKIVERNTVAFEWSRDPKKGGTVVLTEREDAKRPQRRNYFRLQVPQRLKVNLVLSHLCRGNQNLQVSSGRCYCLQGTLVDISEGGAQIALGAEAGFDFEKDEYIRLELTVPNNQKTATFDARVREVLPTADKKSTCLGLQFVGLEGNPEGRDVLKQLGNLVGRYYQTESLAPA